MAASDRFAGKMQVEGRSRSVDRQQSRRELIPASYSCSLRRFTPRPLCQTLDSSTCTGVIVTHYSLISIHSKDIVSLPSIRTSSRAKAGTRYLDPTPPREP